jgi:diguanylate cyclase (GGDEF)-like protein
MAAHRDPPERLNQKLRDGTWLQVREHRSPNGTTVGVRSDVTALKRAEMELRRFAEEDPLTGLLNRARFFHKLDDLLERTFAGQSGVSAVALFDLDHFKPINDTYGHVVGDEVLIEVARRLRLNLESDDFAARLGGDEFVFVMANRADQQACEDDIETLFAALGQAFQTSGPDLEVSLSLGTVFFRDASQPSRHLLKLADLAQYRAKHDGRGRWYRFDESDWRKLDAEASMGEALSADLERYGARKLGAGDDAGGPSPLRFGLMSFADAQSGRPHGFSAEMAWQHEGLLLQGAELRHIAQKANESGRLCEHKLASLLGEVASLEERGIACGRIWITLGAEQLRLARFAEKFNQMRAGFDIAPDRLLLAVEERAFSERSASAIEAPLKELRALGMALGVDQFGSGASRLGLLQSLGVEAVRLAPELCAAALQSSSDEQLVRGLVAMVQPLGMDVVASAVANPRQAALLATLGCTSFQGPLISAPLEAEEIVLFLGKAANQQLAQLAEQISTDKPIGARADAA